MIPQFHTLKHIAVLCAAIAWTTHALSEGTGSETFQSHRPPVNERHFSSKAVEAKIQEVKSQLKDKELAWMFENCFPNTLDTTVTPGEFQGKPDTYVVTGDIDAMWLRDSTAQVWPYLTLMKQDASLEKLIQGVVNRQARCVRLDPYGNAFYKDDTHISEWKDDKTDMKPGLHERKWEIDSLCYVVRLAYGYWKSGGDTACFDNDWLIAAKTIVKTFKDQQRKTGNGPYRFQRVTDNTFDTAAGIGYGNPVKPNGLICSAFRPSDDGTIFLFLIPSNYFAVESLHQLAALTQAVYQDKAFAAECTALADEVSNALKENAVIEHKVFGKILAFEVDGFGSQLVMDDSNIPSLLSLPYLLQIAPVDETLVRNTRRFVLSPEGNPYFVKGKAAEGVSGPHAGRDRIWTMGIVMRAMTSQNDQEIAECLRLLKATHAGTGFMHEGFDKDNPNDFTRPWFAWANTLFAEFILKTLAERPYLLK